MRTMTRLMLTAAVAGAAAACGTEPTSPAASEWPAFDRVQVNERIPISGVTFNPCPPAEPVAYEGFLHFNQHGNVEPGSTDLKTQIVLHSEGVGLLTGSRYTLQQNQRADVSFSAPPPELDQSNTVYTRFIRQGSDDNSYFQATFHVICDASGCRLVENEQERVCRG